MDEIRAIQKVRPQLLDRRTAEQREHAVFADGRGRSERRLHGRDAELRDLLDLLIAERIVLLHSPSGAGKSSLVQAGLIPLLAEEGFAVLPLIRPTEPPGALARSVTLLPMVTFMSFWAWTPKPWL